MKPTIPAILLTATLLLATPALADSRTIIGPGDAFLLGGEQARPIHVVGRNTGKVAVEILSEAAGKRTAIATIAPGKPFDHMFATGQIAVIRNTSATSKAGVSIELTGGLISLSMRYQLPQK